jgi:ectoine hydroxylase-related dioxygenase (phytanoyl-CoA dioxygenase family)
VDDLCARERSFPYDPGDGPPATEDSQIEGFLSRSYLLTDIELARTMRRIRYTRAQNLGTSWPVPPNEVLKNFIQLPGLFDKDRTQYVRNLLNKNEIFAGLVEHETVLELVRSILGRDCVLSDISAISLGPHTEGGSWHVDSPLGQVPEPLPDFSLTLQNAWMLDDFTPENGATRIVPRSHKLRKRPTWANTSQEGELILTAPAGSVAIWLSNTWHRAGPNTTARPRRAILSYYSRSWVKPFCDHVSSIPKEKAQRFSPTLRYLLGFSSNAVVRG